MREFKAEIRDIRSERGLAVKLFLCKGLLNGATRPDLLDTLKTALSLAQPVLFDFSAVPYVDSGALGELALVHHTLKEAGFPCALCNVHPDCLFLINLIGLDRILPVFRNAEEALLHIDGGRAAQTDIEALRTHFHDHHFDTDLRLRGRVLLAVDAANPLLSLMQEVITLNQGCFVQVQTPEDARAELAKNDLWLAILDCRDPQFLTMEQATRLTPDGSLSCRLHLGACPPGRSVFHPDQTETSGFSVAELAALARLEGRRRMYAEALLQREITVELRCGEDACELGRVICERLALTAGIPREEADSFFFAVREAIDNACTHGCALNPEKKVRIRYLVGTEQIEVVVADDGAGFDYPRWVELGRSSNPLQQAQQQREAGIYGGLGIMLMCRCCDSVTYLPPGNTVRLIKHLRPSAS